MGIVAGVVVDVTVTAASAAAEAAAGAAAEAAAEAATEAAAEAAAESAAEAATEGAEEAAAEAEAEAAAEGAGEAARIVYKVARAVEKLSKFTKEFFAIDAVFKTAEKILQSIVGAASSQKIEKLEKLIKILKDMGNKLTTITNWIDEHKNDTVKLDGIDVPVDSGVLAKFMTPLSTGAGVLQQLSVRVSQQNDQNQVITDEQISSLSRSLLKVANTFESLSTYKTEKSTTVPVLSSFPISADEVSAWKADLC
ncbi:cilia- and flagella-associated protein 91-like [Anneissia japonica]|uniref:cilia- and flagella-associated protein 91-like n=1 Tax=Anneissia japonica TaxID=1529436 RepID=UPI00142555CE|nr:cilia- and flagella-associated protein 91-like [Anneissia japonica]XP_033116565.1 cilia- and flagella-associated protein 91-like [Anneissia japonica]